MVLLLEQAAGHEVLPFVGWQVLDILSIFPSNAALSNTVGMEPSTAEDAGVDTLLRDGLRHVMDETKESLFEVERQFVATAIELLEVQL